MIYEPSSPWKGSNIHCCCSLWKHLSKVATISEMGFYTNTDSVKNLGVRQGQSSACLLTLESSVVKPWQRMLSVVLLQMFLCTCGSRPACFCILRKKILLSDHCPSQIIADVPRNLTESTLPNDFLCIKLSTT